MSFKYYPVNSLLIQKVMNGYIIRVKGAENFQEDFLDSEYVFNSLISMLEWIDNYYEKEA